MKKSILQILSIICLATCVYGIISCYVNTRPILETKIIYHIEKGYAKSGQVKYWAYTEGRDKPTEVNYDAQIGQHLTVNTNNYDANFDIALIIFGFFGFLFFTDKWFDFESERSRY